MNKKGFLRIVEASIAIVIIMGVMFVFFAKPRVQTSVDYSERARDILEEISKVAELRESILAYEVEQTPFPDIPTNIEDKVNALIRESFIDYEVRICSVDDVCGQTILVEAEVFSGERLISSSLSTFSPKKIKIFIWGK